MMNREYPPVYKLNEGSSKIVPILLVMGIVIIMWLFDDIRKDLTFLYCASILGIVYIVIALNNVEYALFSHKGLMIIHEKRWWKKKQKKEFYISWGEVGDIRLRLRPRSSIDDIEIYNKSYRSCYMSGTNLPMGKFKTLAQYYSGRDDIVNKEKKPRRKMGLYEKDW